MTYMELNAVFLTIALVFLVGGYVIGARRAETKLGLIARALMWTAVIMVITTAVFDNVIIGVGLVSYDAATLAGIMIGLAPLEDFAYTIAAVMILPALWVALGARKASA